jgi:hypothetical protein
MPCIGILSFCGEAAQGYPEREFVGPFHQSYVEPHPDGEANYIDRHRHVDTNFVSSGGGEQMK